MSVYPWQSDLLKKLSGNRLRLHHALLLKGRAGIGKFDFAQRLSKSLLCAAPDNQGAACEKCASCGWFAQGNHPDFRLLTPEQEGSEEAETVGAGAKKTSRKSQISVAQVRELQHFLELSSHHSAGLRIALIHPAEALNASSANALLKALEEPPPGVIFILVANQPQRLLPTIISRCQAIDMPIPDTEIAVAWLEQQGVKDASGMLSFEGGAPLAVLGGLEKHAYSTMVAGLLMAGSRLDPFAAASQVLTQGMEAAIETLQKWIYDLLASRLTGAIRYHGQHSSALQALGKSVDLRLLLEFQRKLDEARKSANHPLNNELQLEALLLLYSQMFSKNN
ncbi:DNA polymerase III subunit delta' [Methylophilaceae bacterium]|nr:DNA polymerase III subunit delta' [Methylophilaceae bacterium]